MTILVCIDCQNDFITGSLANKEAEERIPNIINKINNFNGDYIFVTQDTHFDNYLETEEGINLPIKHCVKDSYGWEINESIKNAIENAEKKGIKIVKIFKNTFGSYELAEKLRDIETDMFKLCNLYNIDNEDDFTLDIEFVGFCTDICVISNVLTVKSYCWGNKITVDANCCAGTTQEKHNSAIEVMKSNQINIINNK